MTDRASELAIKVMGEFSSHGLIDYYARHLFPEMETFIADAIRLAVAERTEECAMKVLQFCGQCSGKVVADAVRELAKTDSPR